MKKEVATISLLLEILFKLYSETEDSEKIQFAENILIP